MSVLIFLIPIAILLGLLGLAAFIWSMKSGQFEDLEGNGARILFDDFRTPLKSSFNESEMQHFQASESKLTKTDSEQEAQKMS